MSQDTQPGRVDRGTIRTIAVLAALMALVLCAGQLARAFAVLFSPDITLTLLAEAPLPITPDAGVTAASVESASVTADFAQSARLLMAAGNVAFAVTALIVGAAAAWLLWAIASGMRFPVTLYRFTLAAGFALALGPLLGTAAPGFGSMEAAHTPNAALGGILLVGFGIDGWGFTIPLVGFAVLALGYVFQAMRRMQRDTEGLV